MWVCVWGWVGRCGWVGGVCVCVWGGILAGVYGCGASVGQCGTRHIQLQTTVFLISISYMLVLYIVSYVPCFNLRETLSTFGRQ